MTTSSRRDAAHDISSSGTAYGKPPRSRSGRSGTDRDHRNFNRNTGALAVLGGVCGAGAGIALMYLLDPRSGRRRRAFVKDKLRHSLREAGSLTDKAMRDARHRAKGAVAEGRARLRNEEVSDEVLHERVRAQLGRACSHPRAIEVFCRDGTVELCGACLVDEHEQVLANVKRVRGVKEIVDHLELHAEPDVPELQGGVPRSGPRRELLQQSWTPALRLAGIVGGLSLVGFGALRGRLSGGLLGVLGAGLATRALWNRPARALVGGQGFGVEIHKTVHIQAPIDEVYRFFESPENLPRFMTHVADVHHVGDGGYHWEVKGPGGRRFSWDASYVAIENERVSWRSVEGSSVDNEGSVRFFEEDDGTRVEVRLVYNPPAGAMGHAFARALGADPKSRMDDDLLRLKSLLEDGAVTGRFGRVMREELESGNATSPLFGRAGARPPIERQ